MGLAPPLDGGGSLWSSLLTASTFLVLWEVKTRKEVERFEGKMESTEWSVSRERAYTAWALADSRFQTAMSSEPGHCAWGSAAATGSCQHVSFTD